MIPVNDIEDTPVNRKILLDYLTNLQYTKLFMLGSDATNNSQMGMNYDTGYLAAITELKIQIERFNDLNTGLIGILIVLSIYFCNKLR